MNFDLKRVLFKNILNALINPLNNFHNFSLTKIILIKKLIINEKKKVFKNFKSTQKIK